MYPKPPQKFARAVTVTLVLSSIAIVATSCTKPAPEPKDQARLDRMLKATQRELAEADEKLKNAQDSGSKDHLAEQKELVKSRVERLKEMGAHVEKGESESKGGGH